MSNTIIYTKATLKEKIRELEARNKAAEESLKLQFEVVKESMKPSNLLKAGISNMAAGPMLGEGLIKTAAGVGIAMLSKRLFLGKSPGIAKKVVGTVLEVAAANTTISQADKIKAYGKSIYRNLFRKKQAS